MIYLMSLARLHIFAIALLLLTPFLYSQGRQTQTPTQTPATPGGRGRGGVAGPGPAVGGDIDETPVVTKHTIQLNGKAVDIAPRKIRDRIYEAVY